MDFSFVVYLVLGFVALRLNACMERRLQARRTMHALVLPLYTYLGLLDHELQNEDYHADPLITQAVLDHVTELRSFLLQPSSRDLVLLGQWPWLPRLNNILIALEESLEGALQENWDKHYAEIKEQVALLNSFIKDTRVLRQFTEKPIGIMTLEPQGESLKPSR